MSDERESDYLWDPSAPPEPQADAEIVRLETVLARYRFVAPPQPAFVNRARHRKAIAFAAAATIAVALSAAWFYFARETELGYRVRGLDGREFVRAGDDVSTGSGTRARIEIAELGQVDVEPDTRLRVEDCGERAHRLHLERGAVSAVIDAEPRRFQIGTPAGLAVDLGCAYELRVDERGRALLRVTGGQVAFEFYGRDVYVPAGAVCTSEPGRGPQAPVFESSSTRFRAAVQALEFATDPDPGAIADLLDAAEYEDTLTVWHLFDSPRTAPALRDACYAQLARRFPRPVGVSEAGILGGDRALRAAWMEQMKPAWKIAVETQRSSD